MSNSRTQTILVITLLVSATGCSGSRLRNMVGRTEYVPIEELESDGTIESERKAADRREQMLAESSDKKISGDLVSQQREVPEEGPEETTEEEPKKRRGFFDFVRNMRKSDENTDEFSPDPFATAADPEKVEVADTEPEVKPLEQKQVAEAVAKYDETIAAVEKEAESVANNGPFAFETENTVDDAADTVVSAADEAKTDIVESDNAETDNAFAEFANQLDKQPAAEKVAEVVSDIEDAAVASFDELLNQPKETVAEQKTASALSSELFPEMDGDLVDAFDFPEDNKVAELTEPPVADLPMEGWGDDELEAEITDAAQKHGFAGVSDDPWAAFKNAGDAAKAPVAATSDQAVAWNEDTATDDAIFPNLSFAADANGGKTDDSPTSSPFHQVSASRTVEGDQPVDMSPSIPLMIPGAANEASGDAQPWPGTDIQATNDHQEPATLSTDPFLTSVPVFEESADDSTPSDTTVDSIATPAVTTAGQAAGWSRRTWFLLIGCVIVGFLLFMPDRYNRTKA